MDLASDIGLDMGVLKKGPWTSAEDSILISYVTKHGEGNWNSVQTHSGLFRCGKSCRLRWANHLRPNLKKGAFTPEEERIIVELHAKLGNKWARMAAQVLLLYSVSYLFVRAWKSNLWYGCCNLLDVQILHNVILSQLPGRTDNEIKNYWNTRIKRRSRAGLPVYPADKSKISSSQYYVERSGGRSFISGKEIGYDLTSSFSYPGDHLQNLLKANERDSCLLGTLTSMRALPSSGENEGPSQLLNKTMGNQNEQPNVLKHSDQGRSAESNESFSLDQLPEGKNVNFLSDSNMSIKACNHGTMTRPVFTGLANETERNMLLYDRLSAYGHLNMLYDSSLSDASLRLELPSSQSAESATSAGTQRSSITNPSPILTANHILSEVESYGSNSSNFLEVLMQEAHPAEGLEQVRLSMDLIEQLMIFRSGNVPPDVAALLLSPQKRRWDEDGDPTTPLGGRTFSDHSEEISPLCQTANWDEPRGSTIYSLPPASQLLIPRVDANPTEILREGTQQACTDEDFLNLLDMGNSDTVPDWFIPSEYHSLGVVPCALPVDSMGGLSNPQNVAGLDNSNSNINVVNHIWNFGASGSSCTWNPAST